MTTEGTVTMPLSQVLHMHDEVKFLRAEVAHLGQMLAEAPAKERERIAEKCDDGWRYYSARDIARLIREPEPKPEPTP